MSRLNAIFDDLPRPKNGMRTEDATPAYYAFLAAAHEAARQEWTQFRTAPIALGLALLAVTVALSFAFVLRSSATQGSKLWLGLHTALWQQARDSPLTAALACVAVAHAMGIFSFFFLLSEGKG